MTHPSHPPATNPPRRLRLLGNGHYALMLTDAGTRHSQWRDLTITRRREDPTCDDRGSHLLLRVVVRREQPFPADWLGTTVVARRAAFARTDGMLDTQVEVAVAADSNTAVRRITLHNGGAARS